MPPLLWIPHRVIAVLLSAAIIMEMNSCAPHNFAKYVWNQFNGEETAQQLREVIVHLDTDRVNSEIRNQINESKLARLQDLVVAMRRERDEAVKQRDEAREQLLRLSEQLAQQTYHTNIFSKQHLPNKPIGSSPLGLDPLPLHSMPRNILPDDPRWQWPFNMFPLDFPTDQQDDFHQPTASSPIDHNIDCTNRAEKEAVFQKLPVNQQQKNLTSANHEEPEKQQLEQPDQSSLLRLVEDSMPGHDLWEQSTGVTHTSKTPMLGISEASGNGHLAYHNHEQPQTGQILSPIDSNGTVSAMPLHLPEPPETDPDIMLSTLPERGKFLQAVMEAGPLLNTLLVAGPLPEWRHPPPALDTVEIPMLSMCSPAPALHVGHVQPPYLSAEEPLLVTSPVSSSHHAPRADVSARIKEPHAFSYSSSKMLNYCPMMKSHDSAFKGPPLKFAKIH